MENIFIPNLLHLCILDINSFSDSSIFVEIFSTKSTHIFINIILYFHELNFLLSIWSSPSWLTLCSVNVMSFPVLGTLQYFPTLSYRSFIVFPSKLIVIQQQSFSIVESKDENTNIWYLNGYFPATVRTFLTSLLSSVDICT